MYVLCCFHFRDVNFQHVRELSERWMCTVIIAPVFYIIVYSLFPIHNNIVCITYSGANCGFIHCVPCLSITDILSIRCSNLAVLYSLVSAINISVLTSSFRLNSAIQLIVSVTCLIWCPGLVKNPLWAG